MAEITHDIPPAFERACQKVGGKAALMRLLNERGHGIKSASVIRQWAIVRVPADYCPDIEALTGVPCEELRPDIAWSVLRRPPVKARKAKATEAA